jgi:ABC-type transport system involved in multi-copper enzyme maturation permease subunit
MASTIGTIVATDLRLRWRRTSTIVTVLVMIVIAYAVVPDFREGSTVMVVEGRRAIYNSASLSIATAIFASFFLGLFGFYLISNAIERDLTSGTGYLIASTPVRNTEYLAGKLVGNLVFLLSLLLVYGGGVAVMHLLRGEAPLEPLTYLVTYAVLVAPALVFVAIMALLFECLTPLSGRGGDILYFFVWLIILSIGAVQADSGISSWRAGAFDVMGLGYLLGELHRQGLPSNMAVGHTVFDPALTPVTIQALAPSGAAIMARLVAMVAPLPLFAVALVAFHRFDPAKVRSTARSGGRGLIAQLQRLLKPVTRILLPVAAWGGRSRWRLAGQAVADAAMTLMRSPAATVALLGVTVVSVLLPIDRVRSALLPATFVILILALADLPTRDRSAGTATMLEGMPGLKAHRVLWKLSSAGLLALTFLVIPLLRLAVTAPGAALALLVGGIFTAALAVTLGVLTGTPKTFAACFLFFIYLVLNGRQLPALDFAGWNGVATLSVTLGYLVAAGVLASISILWHRSR